MVGQKESLEVRIQQPQLPVLPWYDQGLDLPSEDERFPMSDGTTHPAAYSAWMEEDDIGHPESTPTEPELTLFPDSDDEPLDLDLDLEGDLAEDHLSAQSPGGDRPSSEHRIGRDGIRIVSQEPLNSLFRICQW